MYACWHAPASTPAWSPASSPALSTALFPTPFPPNIQEVLVRKQRALDQIVEGFAAVASIASELGGCAPASWCDVQQQLHVCLGQLAPDDRQRAPLQPHALEFLRVTNNPVYTEQVRALNTALVLPSLLHDPRRSDNSSCLLHAPYTS
jgi:hypothetical protein